MSALFDDAERFDSLIVVGDTVRRVKDTTEEHVGPGTYSPSMARSKDFGHVGVSTSRRSNMDPPTSPRSTEHQRYAMGSVVRDGVWFHNSPSAAFEAAPGPGEYSPSIISTNYGRGNTAKPSSGTFGRQAWDLRGSTGGAPLSNFRDGFTVSSSMGTSPRMADFAQVSLHDGVLLLRGPNDGHRTNGIGPGEYDGTSNRQDPMIKRSYNMRAQNSQVHRERSHSFSGTSSSARAFQALARSTHETTRGRPDLHLLGGMGRAPSPALPEGERRCVSPASALLSSMRVRAAAASARGDSKFGTRTGGTSGSRSLSPKRSRGRSASPIRGARGGLHGGGSGNGIATGAGGAGLSHSSPGHASFRPQQQQQQQQQHYRQQMRGCRSLSPRSFGGGGRVTERGFGGTGGSGKASSSPRAASSLSPRGGQQQRAAGGGNVGSGILSAPSSPRGNRDRTSNRKKTAAGDKHRGGGGGGGGQDAPYTFDYFGLAGQRGAWRGLEGVVAARAEVGIEAPQTRQHDKKGTNNGKNLRDPFEGPGTGGGDAAQGAPPGAGGGAGSGAVVVGGGGPGSLLPEGAPAKGVCTPPKETRDDLHTYFEAVNRTTAALDSGNARSNLPPPPSPRSLRPGSA